MKYSLKPSPLLIVLSQNAAPLTAKVPAKDPAIGPASTVDWAVNPKFILKLTGPLHIVMTYDEVDFLLSGLLHQFASEYALSLNPPCL